MTRGNLVLDTSVYMSELASLDDLLDEYDIILPMVVLQELDNHKDNYSDRKRSYLGRAAIRFIDKNLNRFKISRLNPVSEKPDDKIIETANYNKASVGTKDICMKIKARNKGLNVIEVGTEDTTYSGIRYYNLDISNKAGNRILSSIYENRFVNDIGLKPNEYIVFRDKNTLEIEDVFKWNGYKIKKLRLPSKDIIEPLNVEQQCALDLLNDSSVPIKVITGGFGSGKTMLATSMAYDNVINKKNYSKMVFVRNSNTDEVGDIGFLTGDFDDKTDILFQTLTQHLPMGANGAREFKSRGQLETHIPYYMKGLSIDGYVVVDEAEDLTLKDLKKVGSRIEEGSCIAFVGDYNQASGRYMGDSGIRQLIHQTMDSELVGVVRLNEVVRSEASAIFDELE